ncbi:MAG: RNA methyltransferase [Bacteroidales bacterium]|nr:RNA methyltransferase [Bacteroidales bacterium]
MISKSRIKLVNSLEQKKFRKREGLFVAEGPKLVNDLLSILPCQWMAHTQQYAKPSSICFPIEHEEICTPDELQKLSFLTTPQQVIALFSLPQHEFNPQLPAQELCLALDGVQDPGNLGTIVRLADWFGIRHIFCSPTTADIYSPKAIQATMGAIARVNLYYTDLVELIKQQESNTPIYGTLLDGNNVYQEDLQQKGLLIMGNEGNGLSQEVRALLTHKLFIPSFPPDSPTSESLNVGVATAILCAEFRRKALFP